MKEMPPGSESRWKTTMERQVRKGGEPTEKMVGERWGDSVWEGESGERRGRGKKTSQRVPSQAVSPLPSTPVLTGGSLSPLHLTPVLVNVMGTTENLPHYFPEPQKLLTEV